MILTKSKIFFNKCSQLYYLRLQNIGHRDIKPENIICFENNTSYIFKLSDLGAGFLILFFF